MFYFCELYEYCLPTYDRNIYKIFGFYRLEIKFIITKPKREKHFELVPRYSFDFSRRLLSFLLM